MRKVLAALATLVLLVSLLLTGNRFLDLHGEVPVIAAAFAPYAVVGYVVAIVLLLGLVRRSTRRSLVLTGVVVSLVAIGLHAYLLAPLYYGDARGHQGDLVVLTVNTKVGSADPDAIVRAATADKVDVLVLEEVTPAELGRLDDSGLGELLTHRAGKAADGVRGTMVFSALPLTDVSPIDVSNGGLQMRVGGKHPFRLLAVHTATPQSPARWAADLSALRGVVATAVRAGPVVAAGDFNATTDHKAFRDLLGAGLSDTPAQANSGWQPTWPTAEVHHLFPLVAIDHVLTTSQYSAMSTRTVDITGTDHRGLLVNLDRL